MSGLMGAVAPKGSLAETTSTVGQTVQPVQESGRLRELRRDRGQEPAWRSTVAPPRDIPGNRDLRPAEVGMRRVLGLARLWCVLLLECSFGQAGLGKLSVERW